MMIQRDKEAIKRVELDNVCRNQQVNDKYHFLVDALEFIERRGKLEDKELLAIVGGSFGPDGGASYVEIADVQRIRNRNAEIAAGVRR